MDIYKEVTDRIIAELEKWTIVNKVDKQNDQKTVFPSDWETGRYYGNGGG